MGFAGLGLNLAGFPRKAVAVKGGGCYCSFDGCSSFTHGCCFWFQFRFQCSGF
ncbi:hypothetical protein A2U01_0020602 [Trifolium medium]|uniref:Uncharacterized protein n=1 Tax=Trifolium medium TaxID=97028 RepID=A0A392NKG4_9FABA|nr:hypothetical protein [Trifolium medium]